MLRSWHPAGGAPTARWLLVRQPRCLLECFDVCRGEGMRGAASVLSVLCPGAGRGLGRYQKSPYLSLLHTLAGVAAARSAMTLMPGERKGDASAVSTFFCVTLPERCVTRRRSCCVPCCHRSRCRRRLRRWTQVWLPICRTVPRIVGAVLGRWPRGRAGVYLAAHHCVQTS